MIRKKQLNRNNVGVELYAKKFYFWFMRWIAFWFIYRFSSVRYWRSVWNNKSLNFVDIKRVLKG
jgi:hypothetical protein